MERKVSSREDGLRSTMSVFDHRGRRLRNWTCTVHVPVWSNAPVLVTVAIYGLEDFWLCRRMYQTRKDVGQRDWTRTVSPEEPLKTRPRIKKKGRTDKEDLILPEEISPRRLQKSVESPSVWFPTYCDPA